MLMLMGEEDIYLWSWLYLGCLVTSCQERWYEPVSMATPTMTAFSFSSAVDKGESKQNKSWSSYTRQYLGYAGSEVLPTRNHSDGYAVTMNNDP